MEIDRPEEVQLMNVELVVLRKTRRKEGSRIPLLQI